MVYVVQWKTPDDGQRNCPKHVVFNSKNKFEKLVHLVGLFLRNMLHVSTPKGHDPQLLKWKTVQYLLKYIL